MRIVLFDSDGKKAAIGSHRRSITIAIFASVLLLVASARSYGAETITVSPGSIIQELVKAAPEGTTFKLKPGIYRRQRIVPKNNQKFIGGPGVIINGSVVLTKWRREGDLWVAKAPEHRFPLRGFCYSKRDDCKHREDLFVGNVLHTRSESLDDLRARKWFERRWYDGGGKVYLAENPKGKIVEFGLLPNAFIGDASNVVVKDIIVEKYASGAQRGALEFSKGNGWQLINVVARWNHGSGARIGPGTHVIGGSYNYNGQLGIGGGHGKGVVIDGTEIAYNNYAGYSIGWEAGGTKFVSTDGLIVRNSCVHNNNGPGLWTDIDNINVTYERNTVFNNSGDGIKHEISYKAIIRDNVVANNGYGHDIWLWGSQILVQNSSDVDVFGNTVQIALTYGNGISVIQQDRGEGKLGSRMSVNNRIHDNLIIFLSRHGRTGMVADYERDEFKKEADSTFDNNIYIIAKESNRHIEVVQKFPSWDELRIMGFESNGEVRVQRSLPLRLSCD